ncbi:MAG: ABC transporter permease [Chloroflexota bacterium]|nr:MAG: hypothetical protein DIU68_09200 [Chloroflexota bacterium]
MTAQRAYRRLWLALLALLVAVGVTYAISFRILGGGSNLDEFVAAMTAVPDYQNVLLVNALVGISVALFIYELRWNAVRVVATVAIALALGYLMTAIFNLDNANRFTRGEFRVAIESDAEPVENDDVELEYGQRRGDEFNRAGVAEPLRQAEYRFEGRAGDEVTVLAYAANRRSLVNLQASLIGPDGETLASATSATEAQLDAYDDLVSERDAVIENVTLPADGIYTISVSPEPLPGDLIVSETLAATNQAYEAFLLGPLGRVNRWAVWIQDALSLILVGLAIVIVFRARQFSLGAEGQIYLGALAAGVVVLNTSALPGILLIPLALLSAMVVGFLWGLVPGALKAYLGANELVATLMLNSVAIRFFDLVLTYQLKPANVGYVVSENFPDHSVLPVIVGGTQVTVAVFLVILAVIAVWLLITRTPLGYEIRMIGANIRFADYGGVNTRRTIMLAMAVSGAIAGLVGAHLSMGIHRMLILNISVGLAFEGVVVALLARNNPLVVPFTGLLYAYLRAGAQFMERDANVSFEVVRIIQAVIILLITAEAFITFFRRRRSPRRDTVLRGQGPEQQMLEVTTPAAEEKASV